MHDNEFPYDKKHRRNIKYTPHDKDKDNGGEATESIQLEHNMEDGNSGSEHMPCDKEQDYVLQEMGATLSNKLKAKSLVLELKPNSMDPIDVQYNWNVVNEIRLVASFLKKLVVEDGFEIVMSKSQQKKLKAKQMRINEILSWGGPPTSLWSC